MIKVITAGRETLTLLTLYLYDLADRQSPLEPVTVQSATSRASLCDTNRCARPVPNVIHGNGEVGVLARAGVAKIQPTPKAGTQP